MGDKLRQLLDEAPLEELLEAVRRRETIRPEDGGLFGALERSVEKVKTAFGHAALEKQLDALGEEDDQPKRCPRCSKLTGIRARQRARTVKTLNGEVTVRRNYHWCRHCRHGFYPRDEELGLSSEGELSPELEKRVVDFGINDAYGEAEARWPLHCAVPISRNTFRRVVERFGRLCEKSHNAALDHCTQPTDHVPKQLVVSVDGAHLPIRGSEAWRESKLAVLVRAEHYLRSELGQRGCISRARYAGVLGRQQEFRERLDTALRMERAATADVVWLADGAKSNWRLADDLAPEATQVLDWYHAVEHAAECGRAVFGEQSPWVAVWIDAVCRYLRAGRIDAVIAELEECTFLTRRGRKALLDLRRYYHNNQKRMRYDAYLQAGFPIGSGIVESAHRHVIQRRMKNAGQRWSLPSARRMVRLRCAYRTCSPTRFAASIRLAANLTRAGEIPRVGRQRRRASNR